LGQILNSHGNFLGLETKRNFQEGICGKEIAGRGIKIRMNITPSLAKYV